MFGHCRGPSWKVDDFSTCFLHSYLETIFPLVLCAISLIVLAISFYRAARASKYYHAYQALDRIHHVWSIHVPNPGEIPSQDEEDADEDFPALRTAISYQDAPPVEISQPLGAVWVVLAEWLCAIAKTGIHVVIWGQQVLGPRANVPAIAGVVVWAYVTVLVSIRMHLLISKQRILGSVWYHTAWLYGFLWILAALVFRSTLIHPPSEFAKQLVIADFSLATLLAVIMLCSRRGNRRVEIDQDGKLEPSREPTASVLSLAFYFWVDGLVWKGFKQVLEIGDVWDLPRSDKAAEILTQYRRVKRTGHLALHLLWHFKRQFIYQWIWAAIQGANAFVPILLMKAVLQYVEDPQSVPRNTALFYVVLILCSSLVNAQSGGHALWIGRKICIHLRAIMVGEIYAKALRRRASAGVAKDLGAIKEKSSKGGRWQRLIAFLTFKVDVPSDDDGEDDTGKDDQAVATGAILNLMSVDSFEVADIGAYLHFLWAEVPVLIFFSIYLLFKLMGASSIAGIVIMILLLPANMYVAQKFSSLQQQIMAATDKRIHTTSEILTNIRIIKFFAWETRFMQNIEATRKAELNRLRARYTLWCFASTLWAAAPLMITLATFAIYTMIEKKDLPASVAFPALGLFQILRVPLDQLADMTANVQECRVSIDRIAEFLSDPETEKYKLLKDVEYDDAGDPVIGFDNASFSWGAEESDEFRMMDLDLRFKVGQLNVVVGPTGSGKTSLLMALLGEMTMLKGRVYLPGASSREDIHPDSRTGLAETIAYCAQQAWLVNGTIRENILFASTWDAERYSSVIEACSLNKDLEILDKGDQTLVGEKGVTLSGGQKQRVSLARALYSSARHILLDDVLSAVDSHTATWIFDKALQGPLMNGRTCILVTHNVALCVPRSQETVVLENGRVICHGTPDEVMNSGTLKDHLNRSKPSSQLPSRKGSDTSLDKKAADNTTNSSPNASSDGVTTLVSEEAANGTAKKFQAVDDADVDHFKEAKATGRVKFAVIKGYFGAMGGWIYWTALSILLLLIEIGAVSTSLWIREWANQYQTTQDIPGRPEKINMVSFANGYLDKGSLCYQTGVCWSPKWSSNQSEINDFTATSDSGVNNGYYLAIYGLICLSYVVITFVKEAVHFWGSLAASRKIHTDLLQAVMHARFRFFDATPLGQITNRFSKDIQDIDERAAVDVLAVIDCSMSMITIIILISAVVPQFLIAAALISIIYIMTGLLYINSSRDLKRLESLQRSPLFQQFGETLSGMTTIRAYGDERRFVRENLVRVNTHSRPFIYLWSCNRWLAMRADVIGALISFSTSLFIVLGVHRLDAGAAGLAMTYAVSFPENMVWFMRLYASNEQNMNAVERVKEYIEVEQEAAPIIEDNRPPSNWPEKGSVEFIDYSTRYRTDFDLVLKDVSFKVASGEKVGIVGRTGAGKSSLAMALFRALEAESGTILVDGIDVSTIGLRDLRENVVMVPQDPTLFTGTIRTNLDPFDLFTDEEIFTALRRVQLIGPADGTSGTVTPVVPTIVTENNDDQPSTSSPAPATAGSITENKNVFKTLSSRIAEHGSNLSQGQRQLLCLARAMLKNPKVLLMDEATASIDYDTDNKIQETIREIKNTTITIAHRLQTIIDYDKVLVLDKGAVVEFGSPWDLLADTAGMFYGMCAMSGDLESLQQGAQQAKEAHQLVDVSE